MKQRQTKTNFTYQNELNGALIEGCANGHKCVVSLLLFHKVDVHYVHDDRSCLGIASANGYASIVQMLLKTKPTQISEVKCMGIRL